MKTRLYLITMVVFFLSLASTAKAETPEKCTPKQGVVSPSGRYIAIQICGAGSPHSGIIRIDKLTGQWINIDHDKNLGSMNIDPAWSPDGRWIAFASTRDNGSWEIYIVKSDGSGDVHRMTFNISAADITPTWSPDGRWVAYTTDVHGGSKDIEAVDVTTGDVMRVTDDKGDEDIVGWKDNHTMFFIDHQGYLRTVDIFTKIVSYS